MSRGLSVIVGRLNLLGALAGILSVAVSLWVRVAYRGAYYPGWDLLGPAHGLYLVSTQSFWAALTSVWHSTRHFHYWNHTNSVVYTLIPGYLGSLWPWEYWGHLLTFLLFVMALWLTMRAIDLPLRRSWILLLACGASPALLSFSVAGYPYITGILPHALALWITLHPRVRRSWWLTLGLALIANELSWHLYELGKTLFIVFLAAAFLHRHVPIATRGAWLFASVSQLFVLLSHRGTNVGALLHSSSITTEEIIRGVLNLWQALITPQQLDLPVLVLLGLWSFGFFRTHRWFILILLTAQMSLLLLLAMQGADLLRPRRFLLVDYYCLVSIAGLFRESGAYGEYGKRVRIVLCGALLAGNIWQMIDLWTYVKVPVRDRSYPMPYTYSQADYTVPAKIVDWSLQARSRVEAGEKLLLIYNYSAYPENTTDPAGGLERLYVSLGHDRFVNSVFVFGSVKCRYSCLPIHPLDSLGAFLDSLQPGASLSPASITAFYLQDFHPLHPPADGKWWFEVESAKIFAEIRRRFSIRLESQPDSLFMRFRISERVDPDPSFDVGMGGHYERRVGERFESMPFLWRGLPFDVAWIPNVPADPPYILGQPWGEDPFTLRLFGTLSVPKRGRHSFLLGSDDWASFALDGRTLLANGGSHPFRLLQCWLELEKGDHQFAAAYQKGGRGGRFLLDIDRYNQDVPSSTRVGGLAEVPPSGNGSACIPYSTGT